MTEKKTLPSLIITDLQKANILLIPKSDLSNCKFSELKINEINPLQSLLPGVVFQNCIISNCDFSRCDFEGAKFENCQLLNVSFKNTDIRSTTFSNTKLDSCDFSEAFISDSFFIKSTLINCSFISSSVLNSKFINTEINGLSNTQATLLHNEFLHVTFKNVVFGDCTALYSYFNECHFKQFSINIDALGFSFGITSSDMDLINLIFLGNEEEKPENFDVTKHVVQQFELRQWYLQALISNLNFELVAPLKLWPMMFSIFKQQIAKGVGAKIDDAIFVIKIMHRMEEKKELPFLVVLLCKDILNNISSLVKDNTHDREVFKLLELQLHNIYLNMEKRMFFILNTLNTYNDEELLDCDFVFFKKPLVNLEEYLLALLVLANKNNEELYFYSEKTGSWVKPFKTSATGLSMLLVSLYFLEGCIIEITKIRARTEVLFQENLPSNYMDEATYPKQVIPDIIKDGMLAIYRSYSKEMSFSHGKKIGVSQKNIRKISIKN